MQLQAACRRKPTWKPVAAGGVQQLAEAAGHRPRGHEGVVIIIVDPTAVEVEEAQEAEGSSYRQNIIRGCRLAAQSIQQKQLQTFCLQTSTHIRKMSQIS